MLIALSFAEVGSRFDGTGGPYLYTRAAFGRFAAFEVGWMLWFTRAASWAAVINVLATALGFYVPALGSGWPRAAFISAIIVTIAGINIRGIKQSSLVLNVLTVGKLLPLIAFVVVGIFFIDTALLVPQQTPSLAELSATGLLLIFAFGGYEVVPVPAGEARDPRRAVPFALIMTIIIVTILYDARADRRARHAAGPRGVENTARRRRGALHGWLRRGAPHDGGGALDDRQQHGAGVVGIAQSLRACRAGRSATLLRVGASAPSGRR